MKMLLLVLVAFLSLETVYARSELITKHLDSRNLELEHKIVLDEENKTCTRFTMKNDKYKIKPTTSEVLKGPACQVLYVAQKLKAEFGSCAQQRVELNRAGKNKNLTITSVVLNESCLCTKDVYKRSSVGLGSLNVLETLFNGNYWKEEWASYTTTAQECTQFFPDEAQKQFVLQTYKELGLK